MSKDNINIEGKEKFREEQLKVDNVKINYAWAGKGKPIIMVHGWNNNWIGFIPLAKYLTRDFKVYLVDLPGYGDSDRLEKYSFEAEAEYLKKFVDKLKLDKCVFVGHSMGTFVVSTFYKKYPENVDKLVLIGAVFRKEGRQMLLKMARRFFEIVSKRGFLETWVKKVVDKDTYSYLTAKYVNMYKFDKEIIDTYGIIGKKKMDKKAFVQMGVEIAKTKTEELIGDNKVPIFLLFGKYDKICNMLQAKTCLEGRGKYKFDQIEESGHIVTVERPLETAKKIQLFLNE